MKTDEKVTAEEEVPAKENVSAEEIEKHKKIVVAITVAVVILVFILIAVVIAQIVNIAILNRRKKELQEEYDSLCQQLEAVNEANDILDRSETEQKVRNFLLAYMDMYGTEDPFGVLDNDLFDDYFDDDDSTSQAYTYYGGAYYFVAPYSEL